MASIIKADNIQKVSDGSNIIKKCGSTTTIGSGACSPIVICGSTVTLGRCGGTVTLASGATQTGFGRTGTVDWCTTAKTAPFTGVSGKGYFINTTCGAVTVTLPATPTAGDIISLKDYGGTWQTNNITLCNNGSLINGICSTAGLNTQNQSVTLIYVDGTKGWQDIQDSTAGVSGNAFIVATGGTITTCGDYKIHAFTSDSTFTVCSAGLPANANVDYLVVAGGAGGGSPGVSGGGGAGGYRESYCATTSGCYTASPLASATSLPVTATTYPITVGGGGACFLLQDLIQFFQQSLQQVEVQVGVEVVMVFQVVLEVVLVKLGQFHTQEVQEIHHQLVHHKVIQEEMVLQVLLQELI
jgi:hypothetical protein